ncbi:CHAT domain-containing protein [Nostoc sp. CALU 546]|uniref:CHAT domain-containing protein n=1 Tax=Nostoc sp. CALU 546 TaxID=1867241 RepID=UPI003B67046C
MPRKIRLSLFRYQYFWQRPLRIILLIVMGLILSLGWHILPAQSKFTSSVADFPSGEQLVQQGKTFYQTGKFSPAVQSLQQAVQVYQSQQDILNQALALNYLSLAEQKLGQWNQATTAISSSLNLLTQSQLNRNNAKHILALAYNTQGSLQLAMGQAESALEFWEKSADIYAQIGDESGRIGSLINQTTALQSLGLYRSTMKVFAQVEQNLQSQPNSLLKASGLRGLGNALRVSGELENSQQLLEQSLVIAQQLQSLSEESATLLSLGNTAFAFGSRKVLRDSSKENESLLLRCGQANITENAKADYLQAADFYRQSAHKSTSSLTTIQAQLNRLHILQELHQQPTTEELQGLHSAIASLNPSRATVYARVNFANSWQCLNQQSTADDNKHLLKSATSTQDEIIQILKIAVQQAREIQDQRAESYALGYLGQLYENTQQWSLASQNTESALNLAQMIQASDIAFLWQWQLGRLFWQQQNFPEAIAAYTTAVNTLKSLRSDLVALNPDLQFDFRDQVEPVYRQLVALLLRYEQPSSQNLKQARDVIEALQLAEIDNFFRDACSIAQPTDIDDIVDNSNPATAVIYPIILADRIEVIVKLPHIDELFHYRTYELESQIEATLDELRTKLEQRYTFRDRELLSKKVYDWLITPAEAYLQKNQVKNLVFVLDGSLRNIPMAALYNGQNYLIEKYSIALSPGLRLLEPKLKQQQLQALTAGVSESSLGFSSLPHVANELEEIKSILPGNSKQFLNQNFTRTNIEKEISSVSFPVVHLATHGKFSSQLAKTFILAWNEKINVKQLHELLQTREQVIKQGSRVTSPIELLVLSACETATGDKRAALGLAGIAVRAGARSTLASLWRVDDQSTAVLMSEFYRQLTNNPNLTKSEALRRAQQLILQRHREHPFYWAPYVLVGNWL